jgi:NAD(P)H-hydrate epimerase
MARLASTTAQQVDADRPQLAAAYASGHGLVLCLKGPHSLVASPEGEAYLNTTGNAGMATAGTGDVLAGAIAALMAQGLSPLDAARLGVHAHGLAGDLCARQGQVGLMASDLAGRMPEALQIIAKG